jgi:hypothetical protein
LLLTATRKWPRSAGTTFSFIFISFSCNCMLIQCAVLTSLFLTPKCQKIHTAHPTNALRTLSSSPVSLVQRQQMHTCCFSSV